ncbi:MAG: GNAT family N-acetyltransferase [Saprospiraceae bacterium]|nr:GNAT family N-acetyltransferase [Saprospiraceae bacterium]
MQNWWLDAVCTEGWSVVLTYNKNKDIEAALVFVSRQKWGVTTLSEPLLSPFCGIWFRQTVFQKQYEAITYQKQQLEQLIQQLPTAHRYNFRLSTALTDWQPFYWAGWQQETRYTYRLVIGDLDKIAKGFSDNTKRNIKKSANFFSIQNSTNFDTFLKINDLTYQRQNIKHPIPLKTWQAVDTVLSEKNQRRIFFAKNTEGVVQAAIYVVFDGTTAYYLAGGTTEAGRTHGALFGLLNYAIQEATAQGCTIFDFEGSMLRGVEPFFRGFGGQLTPYFRVFKFANRFLAFVLK